MELKPISLYTVARKTEANPQTVRSGRVRPTSHQLTQKVGSAAHIQFHSKIIAQKFVQRRRSARRPDTEKAYDESMDVTGLIDLAEADFHKVSKAT